MSVLAAAGRAASRTTGMDHGSSTHIPPNVTVRPTCMWGRIVPELPTFRLLITGSRSWKDPAPIEQVIYDMAVEAAQLDKALVVVHGDARGVDKIAQGIVLRQRAAGWAQIYEEAHPARWEDPCIERCRPGHRGARNTEYRQRDYCPGAGRYRNEAMVVLGADACFAFIKDQSPGATHCAKLAEAAGIWTTKIVWEKLNER